MDEDIRKELINSLVREIIGPAPNPEYLDEESGEEILLSRVHGSPQARYGAGMLYPKATQAEMLPDEADKNDTVEDISKPEITNNNGSNLSGGLVEEGSGSEEEPVSLANQFKPSAMGFTVRFNKNSPNGKVMLTVKSAYYEKGNGQKIVKKRNTNGEIINVQSRGNDLLSDYWTRRPFITEKELDLYNIFLNSKVYNEVIFERDSEPWLKIILVNRTTDEDVSESCMTVTFTLVNERTANTDHRTETANILFQNELKLTADDSDLIVPYKEKQKTTDTIEEKELNLLYRNNPVFAIGHGTAVTWEKGENGIQEIKTAIFPFFEMPQIAPTSHVELSMLNLSDLGNWEDGKGSLQEMVDQFKLWVENIENLSQNNQNLENHREAALSNAQKCRNSLNRIENGLAILQKEGENSNVVKAFRWMNRAMIWQQQRSKTTVRKWLRTGTNRNIQYQLEGINGNDQQQFESLEEFHNNPRNGRWRPFQLAFILMNIESVINPDSNERKIVDLIWFPTGGGKTEAYLGLTAFTIFYRRLKGKQEWKWSDYGGTTILMRYTLRLLTTQQYERAASLISACELIRQCNDTDLGNEPITIGLWVGGASTPNRHEVAKAQYQKLTRENNADYNFIVMKCPCCGAQIGKLDQPTRGARIKGITKEDGTNGKVLFKCENPECEFAHRLLPLHVVDEYIYHNPPTLLLGTVDKFAMVTWNKDAGKLFGFRTDDNGNWSRITPPELIIQDELHLISGPLGTMVGLYETMIQTLCNNYNLNTPPFINNEAQFVSPKIIASSATISRAYEQVKSLYAISEREQLNIFPAQGLSFGDTWFSEEKPITKEYPGRIYSGILAPGYPSMQTAIVRAYASLLQKIGEIASNIPEAKDETINYYWTLMGYFNSIRELGGASSLVYSDIRERLGQIQSRELVSSDQRRYIRKHEELTSRISSSQIPEILKKLEVNYTRNTNQALDICLATNMVATGVDISRLGLMFIHGQPKTTAEYIQASSRVGRDVPNGPGLIITLYSPSKPRDKSQYEQFYSYHSRIYSHVEPTSVTPFSISARERALHAVVIGLIRHFSSSLMRDSAVINNNEFDKHINIIKEIILERCDIIDPDEKNFTENLINDIIDFWRRGFQNYGDAGNFSLLRDPNFIPLLYSNSAEVRRDIIGRALPTPTSMRGVDLESVVKIIPNDITN